MGLAAATHTFAAAVPTSCMPVLFEEISKDLGLSLVQIGTVWGMVGLAGACVSLIGGVLGDRFGVKRVLGSACLIGGLVVALRGLSVDFITLTIAVFAFGLIRGIIPPNVHKACGMWFESHKLGMANGIAALGMGIGLMLGPMISATVLSPLLGSWRYVLFLYGAVSIVMAMLWLFSGRMPQPVSYSAGDSGAVPIGKAISRLMRIKTLWLTGLALMFRTGCIVGMVGYLPLYLTGQGWAKANADGTLASFFAISTLCVIPISLLSDRTGSRKAILFVALLVSIFGIGLLPLVNGTAVWIMVLAVGIFMDAYMALTLTITQEMKGVEPRYYGVALGLVLTFAELGGFAGPPLGNSLASLNSGFPLLFWGFLSVIALVLFIFVRETGRQDRVLTDSENTIYPS